MEQVLGHQIVQFLVLILAVIAGILGAKALATRLPNGGALGAIKTAIMAV